MHITKQPRSQNHLGALQRDLVNFLIVTMAISSWLIATLLYFRNVEEGLAMKPVLVMFPVACSLLAMFRNRLQAHTIAYVFAGLLCIAFVSGFLNRAFLGPSMFFLIGAAMTLSFVLQGRALVLSTVMIIGLAITASMALAWGSFELAIDPRVALEGKMSWMVNLALPIFFVVAFTWTSSRYLRAFSTVIEELEEAKATLRFQADHDSLTGLFNERALTQRASQMIASAMRHDYTVAALFIDLDRFKAVNDTRGHEAGDHVLAHIGQLLTTSFRSEDVCARVGGDEFLVLLNQVQNLQNAAQVAARMIAKINQPIPYQGEMLQVSASIGIALLPEHGEDLVTLRKHADQAMYHIKRSGRGSYHIFDAGQVA